MLSYKLYEGGFKKEQILTKQTDYMATRNDLKMIILFSNLLCF